MANNDWLKQNFDMAVMATKAVGTAGITAVVMWVAKAIQTGNWMPTEDIKGTLIVLATAAVLGALVAFRNALKNYWGFDVSKWFGVLLCVTMLQGCVGLGMPGALSKPAEMYSEIKTQMPPEVDPVSGAVTPGESYSYISKKRLPAGTDLEGQDNLDIGIDPDGSWHIRQGQTAGFSSQGQLGGIKDYITTNAQVQSQSIETGREWGKLFATFSGQKLEFDAADEARDDAIGADEFQSLLKYLKGLESRLTRIEAKPAAPPADSPGVDLPEVGTNP